MQIERACADIEVFDLKTAYLGRSHSLLICPPNEYVTAISGGHLIQCGGAQRTHGTTDPGGVWHPVHRKECLTIPLKYLRRKWTMQSTDDDGIVFSTACLCLGFPMRTDWYLRVEKQSTTPVQALAVQPLPD